MEPKVEILGSSLLVPCVQELAKEKLTTVPPRYVRDDINSVMVSSYDAPCSDVPIIDMDNFLFGDHIDQSELKKLDYACKEWGFFQLVNHGVSCSLVEKVKLEIQDFFKLPMEEKSKYWQEPNDLEGFGQAFVKSEEQKLDWADMFYMVTLPTHLRKPRLFPRLPLPLRDYLEAYSAELKNLAMKILGLMAKALNMNDEEMNDLFEEGRQSMRMNYYPPCPQPELVIGLTPHSDLVGLTILLQLNEIEGLQIKKDGMWIPVKPLPNAFIVNVGDTMEIFTNGIYKSIEHRATVNSEKERLSIATFLSGNLERDLGPAPSLLTPQTPALFRRVSVTDYFKAFHSRELGGKSNIDVMRIQNEKDGQKN